MKILIKDVTLITNELEKKCDIYIDENKIKKIGTNIKADGAKIIDGNGKIAMPGFVDMHCHLRDPGYEYKEDIQSGSMSAAKGGFTSIVAMPNTKPVCDNKTVVDYIYNKVNQVSKINVYQTGAISKGLEGKELAEMGEMKKSGIVAVTDDGRPVSSPNLMKKALIYANMLDLPVIAHEEELSLVDDGAMNEGFMSTYLGLRGITRAAEEVMTLRDICLAKTTNTKIHVTHISTKGTVDMIRQAKKDGVKITCDTCPHYFSLTDKMCDGFNTNAKMNPPLREEDDVNAIIEGLRDGTIDAIATDHAPHHHDEKNCEFDKALNGIIGFETAFMLAFENLHKKHGFSIKKVVELLSYNPAKILNLNAGVVEEEKVADIVLISEEEHIYKKEDIVSKSKNTPFVDYKFSAKVCDVIAKGELIIENANLI